MNKITAYSVARTLLVLVISGGLLFFISPFFSALMVGAIIGVVLIPVRQRLATWKFTRNWASAAIVSAFSLVILVPTTLLVVRGSKALVQFLQNRASIQITNVTNSEEVSDGVVRSFLGEKVGELAERLGFTGDLTAEFIKSLLGGFAAMTENILQDFLRQLPQFGIGVIILLLTIYFMLADSEKISATIYRYIPLTKSKLDRMSEGLRKTSHTVVISNLVGGFVQALVFSVGAIALQAGNIFLIAFSVFFLSFIPLVGTAPVGLGLALYYFLQGNAGYGIGWVVVGLVAGISDNIVKPYVIGAGVRIHPFLALLAVLGGVILLGFPGLFIGPFWAGMLTTCLPILLEAES